MQYGSREVPIRHPHPVPFYNPRTQIAFPCPECGQPYVVYDKAQWEAMRRAVEILARPNMALQKARRAKVLPFPGRLA